MPEFGADNTECGLPREGLHRAGRPHCPGGSSVPHLLLSVLVPGCLCNCRFCCNHFSYLTVGLLGSCPGSWVSVKGWQAFKSRDNPMAWLLGTELPSPQCSYHPKFASVTSPLCQPTLKQHKDKCPPNTWPASDHSLLLPKANEREKSAMVFRRCQLPSDSLNTFSLKMCHVEHQTLLFCPWWVRVCRLCHVYLGLSENMLLLLIIASRQFVAPWKFYEIAIGPTSLSLISDHRLYKQEPRLGTIGTSWQDSTC